MAKLWNIIYILNKRLCKGVFKPFVQRINIRLYSVQTTLIPLSHTKYDAFSQVFTTLYSFPNMKPVRFQMFPANFLNLPLRKDILHRAVVYEADNLRQGTACKKNRADVRGSNRKIRPQKGTGRARLGDIRSPTIRGGGLAHAPKPRDFSTKLPRKIYYLAMRTALSARYRRGQIIVINHTFELPTHKTKAMVNVIKTYGWDYDGGGTVFIMYARRENFIYSTANLGKHCIVRNVKEVSVKDLLMKERIIIERKALEWLEEKTRIE
ncbi:50S ribosomal protein L4 [Pneumocystis jirovecii RU7]|uniref:Large ribosomal subunit protein uL4m n=1 Tax=Pneumocystis jirovecii (strain RU7) TaxID=1408657 RepID=A0A0W4ZRL6_PNEJ7|nr:50S ribosomal protein L4 [Pneumocystis jirovecii RU7]KTW31015.1 50S ribosomal protein L4 [Pneumocystis jirovecii RU7]